MSVDVGQIGWRGGSSKGRTDPALHSQAAIPFETYLFNILCTSSALGCHYQRGGMHKGHKQSIKLIELRSTMIKKILKSGLSDL